MLPVGGWAAREVKSGARAEAAEIPKGRALTAGGFRVSPSGHLNVGPSPGPKEKFDICI